MSMIPTRPQVLARLQLRRLAHLNKTAGRQRASLTAAAASQTATNEHTNASAEACWIAAFGGLSALATGVALYNNTVECQEMLHKPPPADAPSVGTGIGPAKNIMLHRLRRCVRA